MSSVASTSTEISRPPAKRVRYLTDDSSYTTSSTAALIRREAEERAAQELEEQRRASRQRVLSVWESLETRYSRALDNDDIVDLESLTVIQDSGTLKAIREVPFGSLAAQDDSDSENDEDEDELGTWDDERHSAETAWIRLQLSKRGPPLTEEDQKDLQEFLRAEGERKQRGEPLDDIYEFTDEERPNKRHPKIQTRPNDDAEDDEEEEGSDGREVNARPEEEDEDDSASSFRPTPSEGRASSPGSVNEGEHLEPEEVELIEHAPGPEHAVHQPPSQPHRRRTPESDGAASTSEDEIGDVWDNPDDNYRAASIEPTFQRRFGSVQPTLSPFTVQIARNSGNPQLSTPPRSKSNGLSTSSDVFSFVPQPVSPVRNSSPRKVRFTKPAKRGRPPKVNLREKYASLIASLKGGLRETPPVTASRKRKRSPSPMVTSPLPVLSISHSPSKSDPWESSSHIPQPKRRPKLDQTPSESGGSEHVDRSVGRLNSDEESSYKAQRTQYNLTFSPIKQGYQSEPPISPIASRTHLPESSEEYTDSPIQPSDLSQLVFHLNKVNEWVKNHQIDGLPMDHLLPSTSTTSQSTPRKNPYFPALPNHINSSYTPQRHHQRFSSLGETSSARSNRSMSSSMGPPPTPLKLFESPSKQSSSTFSSPSKTSSVKTFKGPTSMRSQLSLHHTPYLSTDDEVSSTQGPSSTRRSTTLLTEDEDEDSNVFLTNSRESSPIKLREDIDQWRTSYQRPPLLGTISSEPT
ncbi:hypothetical protein CPB86DRAFT_877133 [Serendipita vermifera]|nr:hypothetical protein CPB86DRAFT_877133 [Serendipita vermifera]